MVEFKWRRMMLVKRETQYQLKTKVARIDVKLQLVIKYFTF